jgi:hypothetical protein
MLGELITRKGRSDRGGGVAVTRRRRLRDVDEFGMIVMVVVNGAHE